MRPSFIIRIFTVLALCFGFTLADVKIFRREGDQLNGAIISVNAHSIRAVVDSGDTVLIPIENIAGIVADDRLNTGPFDEHVLQSYVQPLDSSSHSAVQAEPRPVLAVIRPIAGSTDGSLAPLCRYARRKVPRRDFDVCRDMEENVVVKQEWQAASQTTTTKIVVGIVSGIGSALLFNIAMTNASRNVGDCVSGVFGDNEDCADRPVLAFGISGTLLAVVGISASIWPNSSLEQSLYRIRKKRDRNLSFFNLDPGVPGSR